MVESYWIPPRNLILAPMGSSPAMDGRVSFDRLNMIARPWMRAHNLPQERRNRFATARRRVDELFRGGRLRAAAWPKAQRAADPVEIDVENRGDVERQKLREEKTARDAEPERAA